MVRIIAELLWSKKSSEYISKYIKHWEFGVLLLIKVNEKSVNWWENKIPALINKELQKCGWESHHSAPFRMASLTFPGIYYQGQLCVAHIIFISCLTYMQHLPFWEYSGYRVTFLSYPWRFTYLSGVVFMKGTGYSG